MMWDIGCSAKRIKAVRPYLQQVIVFSTTLREPTIRHLYGNAACMHCKLSPRQSTMAGKLLMGYWNLCWCPVTLHLRICLNWQPADAPANLHADEQTSVHATVTKCHALSLVSAWMMITARIHSNSPMKSPLTTAINSDCKIYSRWNYAPLYISVNIYKYCI